MDCVVLTRHLESVNSVEGVAGGGRGGLVSHQGFVRLSTYRVFNWVLLRL